jgi:hypothetical protein
VTTIRLAREFLPWVRSGKKKSTIREGTRNLIPGPAILASGDEEAAVRITTVTHNTLGMLTEEDAKEEGFDTLSELIDTLKRFYPRIGTTSAVTIVRFKVI